MEKARIPLMVGTILSLLGIVLVAVHPGFIASWTLVLGICVALGTLLVVLSAFHARQ